MVNDVYDEQADKPVEDIADARNEFQRRAYAVLDDYTTQLLALIKPEVMQAQVYGANITMTAENKDEYKRRATEELARVLSNLGYLER